MTDLGYIILTVYGTVAIFCLITTLVMLGKYYKDRKAIICKFEIIIDMLNTITNSQRIHTDSIRKLESTFGKELDDMMDNLIEANNQAYYFKGRLKMHYSDDAEDLDD